MELAKCQCKGRCGKCAVCVNDADAEDLLCSECRAGCVICHIDSAVNQITDDEIMEKYRQMVKRIMEAGKW
jgi:hypothetical protein